MATIRRPLPAGETKLRRSISATDADIPILTADPLRADADKLIGDEYVRCTAIVSDAQGQPMLSGCRRGVAQEDGGSTPRAWPGGTPVYEVGWTTVDILTAIPTPTIDMVGRQFVYQDALGNVYTFNVLSYRDGTPYIDWVNEPPSTAAIDLTIQAAFSPITTPNGVAVDASGNVYVGNDSGLKKYTNTFTLLWSVTALVTTVHHLYADASNAYGVSSADAVVYRRLAATGAAGSPASFGTPGSSAGQLSSPWGIVSDGTSAWVTDKTRNRVLKYTLSTGAYVSEFGASGSANGQLTNPTGIDLDASGNLYVCDTGNHRIQKFSPTGVWIATYGSAGNADGQFNAPEGIAVDQTNGDMWIADTGNHRIQVLNASGVFVTKEGTFGSASDQLNAPKDIALFSGGAYIADSGNNRISKIFVTPAHTHNPTITTRSANLVRATGTSGNTDVACITGEKVTGGGCYTGGVGGTLLYLSQPNGEGWRCGMQNTAGVSVTTTAWAICPATPF